MRNYCFLEQSPWGELELEAAGLCLSGGAAWGSYALLQGHCQEKRFEWLSVLWGLFWLVVDDLKEEQLALADSSGLKLLRCSQPAHAIISASSLRGTQLRGNASRR